MKRLLPVSPNSGETWVRLIWSVIIATAPAGISGLRLPPALVTMTAWQPKAASVSIGAFMAEGLPCS